MIKKIIIISAILLSPLVSLANDAIGYSSAGGIVLGKTSDISMKKEVLNLSYKKISVDYDFINEGEKDLEEIIIFPLPSYTANYGMGQQYYGEPYNFLIEVNGKKVNYTTQIKAINEKKDITNLLKSIGLSEEQIAYFILNSPFNIKVKPLTKNQFNKLLNLKLLDNSSGDGSYTPVWSVEASYIWKQKFPAKEILKVHHEYVPFVAAGPGVSYIDKDIENLFCMDESFKKSIFNIQKRKEYVPVYHVSYILMSANTWKNGIEDFTLNINKGSSQELVSLCFPGEFQKINPTTLQVHLTNFKPSNDLLVFFGNYKEDSNNYSESHPIKIRH